MDCIKEDDSLEFVKKIAEKRGVLFHQNPCSTESVHAKWNDKTLRNQNVVSPVPPVPSVPPISGVAIGKTAKKQGGGVETPLKVAEAEFYFCERAAIREFDGGMTRAEAESQTRAELDALTVSDDR